MAVVKIFTHYHQRAIIIIIVTLLFLLLVALILPFYTFKCLKPATMKYSFSYKRLTHLSCCCLLFLRVYSQNFPFCLSLEWRDKKKARIVPFRFIWCSLSFSLSIPFCLVAVFGFVFFFFPRLLFIYSFVLYSGILYANSQNLNEFLYNFRFYSGTDW